MEEFSHLEGDEKLKAEDDFLKIKLMLERGGQSGLGDGVEIPAESENQIYKM